MMTPLNHKQRVSTALSHEIHAFFSCLMSLNKRSWGHQYQSVNLTIKTKILTPDLHLERKDRSVHHDPFSLGLGGQKDIVPPASEFLYRRQSPYFLSQ